jgi:hypothetical protein
MEGGYVHGREAVRSYWTRQWAMIEPHVEPLQFSKGPEDEVIVEVHQIVRDVNGTLVGDKLVGHVFRVEKGLPAFRYPKRVVPIKAIVHESATTR